MSKFKIIEEDRKGTVLLGMEVHGKGVLTESIGFDDEGTVLSLDSLFIEGVCLREGSDGYYEIVADIIPAEAYDGPLDRSKFMDLERKVYPSQLPTILAEVDDEYGTPETGGAHHYVIRNSMGFSDGEAKYHGSSQIIRFVKKEANGLMLPGIQSEQLALVLLDRTKKLNDRFPSEHNEKMIEGLEMFITACEDRVRSRMTRGVMGELKK